LADVLAGLSLIADLGVGREPEQAMRTCLLACRLAEGVGLAGEELHNVYYAALLEHVGCTGGAHEASMYFGDDIALYRAAARANLARRQEVVSRFIPELVGERALGEQVRVVAVVLGRGGEVAAQIRGANCEVAAATARRLGFGEGLVRALSEMFEWWNGHGPPRGLAGEEIALPARIVRVASLGLFFASLGGMETAVRAVRERAGTLLDPGLCERFAVAAPRLLAEAEAGGALERVLEAEPHPWRLASGEELDSVARAFGELVDLKSPFFHGHSSGVAELAVDAAAAVGLDSNETEALRRAAFLHDVGRAAVPSGVWEKPGPLTAAEWERVRLHAYHSERVLMRSSVLAPLASLAGMHHERLDGSGYHRGAKAGSLPRAARLLAAADAFQAMTQARPHRAALAPEQAARESEAEGRRGRLDPECVRAVCAAAGGRPSRRRSALPAGLSERELEVLRLVARGCSNREIGRRLWISPKTAGHHVQHIYAKIGASTRAAAALFAMEHDLLGPPER
jgi:HD-GYP domain-containing protein (c-di-GMP phosphodiesterase class II)